MPSHQFFRSYSLLPVALLTLTATAGDIQLSLEEPMNGSFYSGISNLRGWAISSVGINRVELFLDGTLLTQIPSGSLSLRTDVGNTYPTYPNSSQSGFSWTQNYALLTAGPHTISVNVVDNQGSQRSAVASFNVTRFNNSYISNPATVSLNAATITDDNDKSISISNLQAGGQLYNVRLEWRTQIQGFALTSISPVGSGSARWTVLTNVCCESGPLTYQVTIDNTTQSSTINSCNSNASSEGFASTTPGAKNWVARVVSSACGINAQGSGNVTLASDACYRFVLNRQNQSLINSFGTVTCPSSANANTLQEESQATPMAIFPMQPVDPLSAGQENWNLLRNIREF
jgi:hypothetical protein